jgi:hypothetical protein
LGLFANTRLLSTSSSTKHTTAVNEFYSDKKVVNFGNPAKKIEAKFERCMKSPNVPLLRDFKTYASHLPVRTAVLELYKLDYLVRSEALEKLSADIENPSNWMHRQEVKYLCAPSGSGKSASVLPAFLVNEEATHYFYLPFHNNNDRLFKSVPHTIYTDSEDIAERQGAAFMVECVKRLLDEPISKVTRVNIIEPDCLLECKDYSNILQNYLDDKLGTNAVVWFHVDEHGKMIDREHNAKAAAAFSKGAMGVLTLPNSRCNTRVVASYTEPPSEIPAAMSPGVCRIPVALPPLDPIQVMSQVPELYLDKKLISDGVQRKLLASLRVRIAMKVRYEAIPYLHRRGSSKKVEEFLKKFEKIAVDCNNPTTSDTDRRLKLIELNKLCKIAASVVDKSDEHAAELLVGVGDDDKTSWINEMRISNRIAVLPNKELSVDIKDLLNIKDPKFPVYVVGRQLLMKSLTSTSEQDLLSNRPLEAAYSWSLACRSAVKGGITFGIEHFAIKCENLERGRLFPGTDSTSIDVDFVQKMQQNTIYYVHEKVDGQVPHLVVDLFFKTCKNELVVVDIADGGVDNVADKEKKMVDWITDVGRVKLKGTLVSEIHGVVLAPNVKGVDSSYNSEAKVGVIRGSDALSLLGGLQHISEWLVDEEEVE